MKPKTGRVEDTDDRTISRRDLIKTGAAIAAAARNAGEGADTATLIRQGLKELAR